MSINFQTLIGIWLVFEWIIRIGAFFVIPRNRKPSSATAWLLLIMITPTLGLLVYLFIGSPKLPKKRRAMQNTMDDIIESAIAEAMTKPAHKDIIVNNPDEHFAHIVQLNTKLGKMPVFKGNKVELLPYYDEAIRRLVEDVKNAKTFVHLEFFIIALDETTKPLFEAMAEAVKRGVKVRVLFDAVISRRYPQHKKMKETLTKMGVEWYAMLPLKFPGKNYTRPDLRNHRKIAIIDGQYGYMGSLNLITRNYHRKDKLYYDELVTRLQGPVLMQLQSIFMTDWYSETGGLLSHEQAPETHIPLNAVGKTMAQVLPSGPGYDNDNNLKLFTSLIHSARKKLVIVNPYFVPDDSLMTAITSASQRGVEVILINSEIMDQRLVGHAQRSYYEELLRAGVAIYWYEWPILLHSKCMTIDDDIAVIGSSNLDIRSFTLDHEVTLVIYDEKVVEEMRKIEARYLKASQMVRLEEWYTRSWYSKLWDNLARLTAALQ